MIRFGIFFCKHDITQTTKCETLPASSDTLGGSAANFQLDPLIVLAPYVVEDGGLALTFQTTHTISNTSVMHVI